MSELSEARKALKRNMQALSRRAKLIAIRSDTAEGGFLIGGVETFQRVERQIDRAMNKAEKAEAAAKEAKEHFESIFNMSPDATLITRLSDSLIVDCNEALLALSGYTRPEVIGVSQVIADLFADGGERAALMAVLREKGACENIEVVFRKKNGAVRTGLVSARVISLDGVPHVISITRDITDRKHVEEALRKSEARYRMLAESIRDVIWILDVETLRFLYVSPSVYELRGYTPEEILAQPLDAALTPDGAAYVRNLIQQGVADYRSGRQPPDRYYVDELAQPCKDGSLVWTEVITKYYTNPGTGRIELRGVTRDISERKDKEAEILYLSYHDQLTGLYNRRFYEEELQRLDIERNLPITLVMADVNGLKLTNDAFGHVAGDELLREIANIIKSVCRSDDIVARIGGDEFMLLLPKTDSHVASEVVRRIKAVARSRKVGNTVPSVSFGWSTKTLMQECMSRVYMQAEDRMYRNKLSESTSMKSETIRLITKTMYEKNEREEAHSKRVSQLCEQLGLDLGMSADEAGELRTAGLMHDIGKIGVSESVLTKVEPLTEAEWLEIKRHPETGYHILSGVHVFAEIAMVILAHHEFWYGTGYPKGLKGEAIPFKARVLAIAEAYDAMTNSVVNKQPLDEEEAVRELHRQSGTQFDARMVQVFVGTTLSKV